MAGFTTLDREAAARILFGDRLDDPDADFWTEPFESGADIAESLASWFGFTVEDYDYIRSERAARAAVARGDWQET